MKRCFIGIAFLVVGTLGFSTFHKIAVNSLPLSMYYNKYGEYIQSLINNYSLVPMIISCFLFFLGLIILCKEYVDTFIKKQ
ncbi:hypothetical protein [Lachnoclostridium phytofermentans]|uniref:Uncharacterized protein n=1 Tax=Lachnoclostridium phytofermentans (strain ATCC 700394 / DSM 18823 / ISDg) TaxID=357809 RepID=A9KPE4_LACP7|nr:hypothetical protein [Lachnoclostridium phytofermentans]ABX41806.1 hypothetical protein Cphy_1431 [Lachnoclostridium phytofermentans ISDg]